MSQRHNKNTALKIRKKFLKIRIAGIIFLLISLQFIISIVESGIFAGLAMIFLLPAALLYLFTGGLLILLELKMKVALTVLTLAGILYALYGLNIAIDGISKGDWSITSQFLWFHLAILISHLFILYTFYISGDKVYFRAKKP